MGTLRYTTDAPAVVIPDRALEHLHIVVARKLREHQRFAVTIITNVTEPVQVWLDARIPIVVTYASGVASAVNKKWLKELEASFGAAGLVLTPEPAEA